MIPVPMDSVLGLECLRVEGGRSHYRAKVGDGMTNPFGQTHGGWYATILDSAMGQAVASAIEANQVALNVDLQLHLLSATSPGDVVDVEAKTTKRGRSAVFMEAEATSGGRVVARASSVFLVRSRPE